MSTEDNGTPPAPSTPTPAGAPQAAAGASGGGAGAAPPPPPTNVLPVTFEEEMQRSYLDYAMSVIVGRAIPDARDGLKPVHRRILYTMDELKLGPSQPYKKCAKVVGDTLGKLHPHGDSSVYDALVRMAQDFSMRMPLVDGQGNFGSVEGDPAAAYRYTECRLTRLAEELLRDIDKETVDFSPTYDDSSEEPDVLPARFPNLLVNGTNGIAVGMATNIPPHNLGEVLDGCLHLLEKPEATVQDLMHFVKGPDFPTAGSIQGTEGIRQAYLTGRGAIIMRAKAIIEPMGKGDRERIVVTEIPYQVNSARLVEKIAEHVREKRIEGISDIRNESSREGMRIVVELRRDAVGQVVLNKLYKMTQLQESFGYNALAIVGGQPRLLDLRQALQVFLDHRRDVVTRRTRFELRKAESERELVLGLGMATTEIDLVIKTIRESPDADVAKEALMRLPLKGLEDFVRRAGRPESEIAEAAKVPTYTLTERQAKAILDMRLARLTGLEREKLAVEYGNLSGEIARLSTILRDEGALRGVIENELREIREKYADARRTEIMRADGEISVEDLIAPHECVVTCSHAGYIKRTSLDGYRQQKRGGKGSLGLAVRDEDWVHQLFSTHSHGTLIVLSDKGKAYTKKVYEIPEADRASRGKAIVNFVGMEQGERVAAVVPVREFKEGWDLVTLSRNGLIKRTELSAYENIRASGIIAVAIEEGDALLTALIAPPDREVLIGTRDGSSIRYALSEVRQVGRDSRGVRGIDLREGDRTVGMDVIEDGEAQQVLAVCENGYGKRTEVKEHRAQGRGGLGVIAIDASERNGKVVDLKLVRPGDQLMVVTDRGQLIRTSVDEVRLAGRNTQGVRIIDVKEGEKVVAVERIDREAVEESERTSLPAPGGEGEGAAADPAAEPTS